MTASAFRAAKMAAVLTALLTLASSHVLAQGYEGLIPDDTPPPAKSVKKPAAEQPGYSGVVPGTAPAAKKTVVAPKAVAKPAPAAAPKAAAMTPNPATPVPTPVTSAGKLKNAAMMERMMQSPEAKASIAKMPQTAAMQDLDLFLIDGMTPMEYSIKETIDDYMKIITDKNVPEDKRRTTAKIAYDDLNRMAEGLRLKASVPNEVFYKMGASKEYVDGMAEGDMKALNRLDAAFQKLRTLQ